MVTDSNLLNRNKRWLAYGLWLAIAAATTALLVAARGVLDKSHVALAYLLVVLLGASRLGRRGGVVLALVCFFAFNFFLLPPYHTFVVTDQRDWLVLLAFLLTSLIGAQLLYRAQREAEIARARSIEIDRLSTLGAETLSAGRAEDAVASIARVVQTTLNLSSCEIYLAEGKPPVFRLVGASTPNGEQGDGGVTGKNVFDYVIEHSTVAVERVDASLHVLNLGTGAESESTWTQRDAKIVVLPLKVRGRAVGIMRLSAQDRIYLTPEQRRFAQALAYYAALGLDRVRLLAEAERSAALKAADRLKDSFVAAVSHDLRTPLTTIKGLAHEMADTDERAAIIEAEADRLNHFVRDVLDLSRINAGELRMEAELNAADDLVGAALAQVTGLPRAKEIRVHVASGDVIVGNFDFVHSLRCLVNLIENALKYSPPDTPVEIVVDRTNGVVHFAVMDRGPGIKPQDLPRIFEPFVRVSSEQTGTGLGLAIARRIAIAQGGDVTYAPREGGGSVFTLTLPGAPAPQLAS